MSYTPENPTSDIGDDAQAWLARELQAIQQELLNLRQFVIDWFSVAGYGGLYLTTPTAGSNITTTWQTITYFDSTSVTTPRFVVQDLVQDGLILELRGVWVIAVNFSISHNEVNSGREMEIRLYNNDTGVGGNGVVVGTGRNQGVTNFGYTALVEVPDDEINNLWQLQIRSPADTYSSVDWEDVTFDMWHISNYQEPL